MDLQSKLLAWGLVQPTNSPAHESSDLANRPVKSGARAEMIACNQCDLLMAYPQLSPGEKARCPRCDYAITSRGHQAMDRLISMSITGLLLLLFASVFPFLGFSTSGQEKQITLLQTASTLWENNYPELGVLTAIFIIIAPATFLGSLLYVLLHLRAGVIPWGGKTLCKWMFHLIPWAMAEVFFLGVLVSLIKVAAMAAVEPGLSLWAFVLFCLVFPAVLALTDRYQIWFWMDHGYRPQTHE